MGLFINKGKHPDVFKNTEDIKDANQAFYERDYFSDLVNEQKKAYETLEQSLRALSAKNEHQDRNQTTRLQEIGGQLEDLQENIRKHEDYEEGLNEWLMNLDDKSNHIQATLEAEELVKKELLKQLQSVTQSNEAVRLQLGEFESANAQLTQKVNEQAEVQKQISEQLTSHEDTQQEVIKRMENQEALTDKILRQIEHIRSTLFERTSYLAEKIENSYKLTSSYVHHLMLPKEKK
ncbi:hypothetical protein [Pseudogracilibacillus auburnensis]|uniref:hypothetical protein n=1 Tax=Pseudogracilibacillus auburnensis TaxID=1494959 RepID=UPI001A97A498|nr:hypothetical protein [Pseudogracilibacillus auburnensis]MBO1005111.1 hypothetical protein [Pseudogracilibacillus auburnensis]